MALDVIYKNLGTFGTCEEAVAAYTNAFCDAFGWTLNEDGWCYDGDDRSTGVMFDKVVSSDTYIRLRVKSKSDIGTNTVAYSNGFRTSFKYFLCYIRTPDGKTFAFDFVYNNPINSLKFIIADDTSGNKAIVYDYGFYSNGQYVNSTGAFYSMPPYTGSTLCTSIVKEPNIYTGAMMKNLYKLVSAPFRGSDLAGTLLLIDGRYYRVVGNPNIGHVIPVS